MLVCYIDYGNSEEIDLSDLRQLPVGLATVTLPPQAKECLLSDVRGVEGAWSGEAVTYFEEIVLEKALLAEVVRVENMNANESVDKCIAVRLLDMGMSVAQKLREGGFATEDTVTKCLQETETKVEEGSREDFEDLEPLDDHKELNSASLEDPEISEEVDPKKEPCTEDAIILPMSLPVKVQTPVYLSHCESPSNFFIQLADTYELDQLNERMQQAYTDDKVIHKFETRPKSGMMCAVFSPEDHSWYRAKVLHVGDDGILVSYIDFGNNETIKDDVKPLQKQFLDIPAQAVQCTLSDICPLTSEDNWSQDCIETFMAETGMQRELLAEIQADLWTPGPQGDVIGQRVKLFADGTLIADTLVDAGLATYSTECEMPKFR